jgi:hypothetical protein
VKSLRRWAGLLRRSGDGRDHRGAAGRRGSFVQLVPARPIQEAPRTGEIEVVLGNGRVVRVTGTVAPEMLARVLQVAEERA